MGDQTHFLDWKINIWLMLIQLHGDDGSGCISLNCTFNQFLKKLPVLTPSTPAGGAF